MSEELGAMLDGYFKSLGEVCEAFGYKEDWCVFPVVDQRRYWWHIAEDGDAEDDAYGEHVVQYWREKSNVGEWVYNDGYEVGIDPNRFLPKSVYEGDGYTMILVDTRTDGNKVLAVFDNAKQLDAKSFTGEQQR